MALPRYDSGKGRADHDPLEYWLEQERSPLPEGAMAAPLPRGAEPAPMPGGWWLLPVMVMALPVWGVIFWLLLSG